ncbi:MAG: putative ubiquitin 2 [Streblomastix strix]|uniref:Putative ubiquitin 2 n=1 Tax=Streblomastix strix TaxID=222440 RepID=A0A5J4VSN7_9EUKA|nr:MAG: putative ubiquitin 2 [Streblomastix strix]
MEFYVKLNNYTVRIDVKQDDTILSVKLYIQEKQKIPVYQQRLVYAGEELDDDRTIQDCHINRGSLMHMVIRGTPYYCIETPQGTFLLEQCGYYQQLDAADYLKKEFEDQTGIPMDQQQLICDGKELKDNQPPQRPNFNHYNILKLKVLPVGVIPIYVKSANGKIISLKMKLTDTIQRVKQKIEKSERIPKEKQQLSFAGNLLKDMKTLLDYQIEKESTLHLTLKSYYQFEEQPQSKDKYKQIQNDEDKYEKSKNDITQQLDMQKYLKVNILALLKSITALKSEKEKIIRAQQLHNVLLKEKEQIDNKFCSELMNQIEEGSTQTQKELIQIVGTIAQHGLDTTERYERKKFFHIFEQSKLENKIEEIMRREMKDEENEAKGRNVQYSENILTLFEIVSQINNNWKTIGYNNTDSIQRFFVNFFTNLINNLSNQNQRKDIKKKLITDVADIDKELNNGIRVLKALNLTDLCNRNILYNRDYNRQYFNYECKMMDSIAPLIHLNCPSELNCPHRISIPKSSSLTNLFAAFFDMLFNFGGRSNNNSGKDFLNRNFCNFIHMSQDIIAFTQNSTDGSNYNTANDKIAQAQTQLTDGSIEQYLNSILILHQDNIRILNSHFIIKLLPSVIKLSTYNVGYHKDAKTDQQSLNIRLMCLQILNQYCQRVLNKQIHKKFFRESNYIQSLTSEISNCGGSGEENDQAINCALNNFAGTYMFVFFWLSSSSQILKEIHEQVEEEGTDDEVESILFNQKKINICIERKKLTKIQGFMMNAYKQIPRRRL